MKESNVVKTILVATAVTVMAIPAIAGATPYVNDGDRTAVRVAFTDLDLTTQAGLQVLYGRLKAASSSVCGSRSLTEAGSLKQLAENKRCYQSALSKVVAKLNNAELSEIHEG